MNQIEMIDVTKLEPHLKHITITNSFDQLHGGEAILIHNDHDPKPLCDQLISEKGNCFSWAYIQNGPEIWEIEIRKNTTNSDEETLGEIASKDLRKAEVFKLFALDFCCGGKQNLQDACTEKGLDFEQVKAQLKKVEKAPFKGTNHDFNSWNLSFLSDYIVNVHHNYVRQNIPILIDLCYKVLEHHGKSNPELEQINSKINEISIELKAHMTKEENFLFPYIKQLKIIRTTNQINILRFKPVPDPITSLIEDHTLVGGLFHDIHYLTFNYVVPPNACNSYALLYKKLEEFEDDLHLHIHLENNILFPKAIKMESMS